MVLRESYPLKFPHIYVVEASAGSGKTHVLAKRYIQLLMSPELKLEEVPLRDILAITFTNKAAIEMKERILEFLKKIALDKFDNEQERNDILQGIFMDERFIQKKAYLIMEEIIKNYNFFQVQTIDSFINSLLSGCAFRLGLSSTFKIKDALADYLVYSFDRFIDRAGEDKQTFSTLESFLRQYIYLENKTSWLPKQNIISVILSLFDVINTYPGKFLKFPVQKDYIFAKRKTILKLMQKLYKDLPVATNERFRHSLENFLSEHREGFDIDDIISFFDNREFPIKKGYPLDQSIVRLWQTIRKNIKDLSELESRAIFNSYIDIFEQVSLELHNLAVKEDLVFLQELNKQARLLFEDEAITVPELYYRLATRLRHFLIDEFQDTSILQWINLFPMVEEAISTGGSLFYVGDKKQAIYRFRGGEVGLFDWTKEYFKDFNLRYESLNKNFRSQKEIVEFNNEIFSPDNLRRFLQDSQRQNRNEIIKFSPQEVEDIIKGFYDSKQSIQPQNAAGYVRVEQLDSDDKESLLEDIKERLISLIKELKHRFAYRDITVLTRKNEDVKLMTEWILRQGIPVESEKTLNIRENPFIKELVSFLRFLNSPIDDLSFASFILGEIFSSVSGIANHRLHEFIFDQNLKRHAKTESYLYREFRNAFSSVWDELIEEFFKSVGFIPLYELVVSIIERFKILENFPDYQGFFMRFLELIKKKESDYPTLALFLEYFEHAREDELYVYVADSDAIKILTIHKAKGLEFPVVILPFVELEFKIGAARSPRATNFIIQKDEDTIFGSGIRLLRLKKRYTVYSAKLREEYKKEYIKVIVDELNSTYVAFTRAKEEMYIFIPKKLSRIDNPARFLIAFESLERGRPSIRCPEKKQMARVPIIDIAPNHYKDWITFLREEFRDEIQLKNIDRIKRGEILHHILSYIGNLIGEDIEKVLQKATENTHRQFYFVKDFTEYTITIRRLLDDTKTRKFFFIPQAEVYQEKEIVDTSGNTKRIDRLIVSSDEVWVIDYKSAKDSLEEYHRQIREYINLFKELYPRHKVRGFLVYLEEIDVEEVNAEDNNL
ncbi:MAG: UvrD-helicase domain-containing protein [Candidatus Omnitrophica bacterium]|nr:UvrD-helicase domain-containing protein [Candidatus Omnitrophota bacterium]